MEIVQPCLFLYKNGCLLAEKVLWSSRVGSDILKEGFLNRVWSPHFFQEPSNTTLSVLETLTVWSILMFPMYESLRIVMNNSVLMLTSPKVYWCWSRPGSRSMGSLEALYCPGLGIGRFCLKEVKAKFLSSCVVNSCLDHFTSILWSLSLGILAYKW